VAATLAETMADDRVPFDELHRRYHPVLAMVETLIGVVPNCDPYLEIWPPGFRTYNLIVPNFLNLPISLTGIGAPKDLVGLAMYTSSRAAGCAYCSAHTCSFALRRGSSSEAVTGASRTPVEEAVVALAESLSRVPADHDPSLDDALERHLSADDAEWVVMGVAMMGFLNKFMDALGVELEQEAVDDVAQLIEPTGWSVGQHEWAAADGGLRPREGSEGPRADSVATALPVLRNAFGAIKLDRQWMAGVPKDAAEARRRLAAAGFDEPLVETLRHARPRRALAAVLTHNIDPDQSALGLGIKALGGVAFARRLGSDHLVDRSRQLAERHGLAPAVIDLAEGFRPGSADADDLDDRTRAVLRLANAFGPSPAEVDREAVEASSVLEPAEIVELAVWVSVLQLIHRLTVRRLARTPS
jgi:alkylhydroperoxidase family enzyme